MKRVSSLRLFLLCFLYILFTMSAPIAVAKESVSFPIIRERALPESISFSINATQTAHTFFEQAVAQDDGTFAICVRFTDTAIDAFSQVYIDVFEPSGAFWKEICFSTQFEVTIDLKDSSLYLYFYDYMIVFDLLTEEATCFEIAPNSLRESGLYRSLHRNQFTCGEWLYCCKKSIWGYSELTRSNGEYEQIMVSYVGMEAFVLDAVLSVMLLFCLVILLIVVVYRIKKNTHCN